MCQGGGECQGNADLAGFWCSGMKGGLALRARGLIASSPFLNLLIVLRNLRGQVGGWCGRGLVAHALGILLFDRLAAVILRLERMTARFLAGGLRRFDGRVFGERTPRRAKAAGFGSQLRAVLETPEMVALLTASPQAGRMLLPVCRALGVETALLRPGVVAVARVAVVRERVRKVRVKPVVEPFRIPLPRGVLAWAKREGYGKIR
eukprot:gene2695-2734_t